MNILVTGGAGFIGSHLVDALIERNHQVTVVDDLTTGRVENVHPSARFRRLDIRAPDLEEIFRQERFDVVFHYAALVDVRESVRNPSLYREVNVGGSINVLRCCERYGVGKVIYASSVAVYGEPRYIPVDEVHPTEPLNDYGASKLEGERYLNKWLNTNGPDSTILRYSNVYGPRQNDLGEAGVVATFARRMLRAEPIIIFGSGDQVRDFVFVDDAVQAALSAVDRGSRGVYNIGTGRGTSVRELFALMKDQSDYRGTAVHDPPRDGEISRMVVDATTASIDLDWRPGVSLEEGTKRTLDYMGGRLAREA